MAVWMIQKEQPEVHTIWNLPGTTAAIQAQVCCDILPTILALAPATRGKYIVKRMYISLVVVSLLLRAFLAQELEQLRPTKAILLGFAKRLQEFYQFHSTCQRTGSESLYDPFPHFLIRQDTVQARVSFLIEVIALR
jgi:hypothetical protein